MNINKEALRQEFLKLEKQNLIYSKDAYNLYFEQAKLDRSSSLDDQDRSQAKQAGLLAEHFECPIHNHEIAIEKLTHLNLQKTNIVESGAFVRFNNKNFLVGIASGSITYNNQQFIGLSTNSPNYQEIEGRTKGEEFMFNGKAIKIEDIQ